jgi:hypothetical protein
VREIRTGRGESIEKRKQASFAFFWVLAYVQGWYQMMSGPSMAVAHASQ